MISKEELKNLLKQCVTVIDDWDLVHGAQDEDSFQELVKLLAVSAHVAGMDPNKLHSLQPILKNGKYKIDLRPIVHEK